MKIVFTVNGHDASLRRWSVGYLSEALRRSGVDSSVVDMACSKGDEWDSADVVLFYRSFDIRTMAMMRSLKKKGKMVMYFLDDYLFQPECRYTREWKVPVMDYLNEADCLVSSSAVLLSKMPDKPKILRRSVLDGEAMKVLSCGYRRSGKTFSMGWLSGRGRQGLMNSFAEEFLRELDGMLGSERMEFKCFGKCDMPRFERIGVKAYPFYKPEDWKGLYSAFVGMDLGVVVNMLDESDDFCRCKSELKFVESGAMGVPLVTSRVEPYLDILEEGVSGFFASTPREFAEKVVAVARDEEMARRVSRKAREMVVDGYDVGRNAEGFWKDVVEAWNVVRPESRVDKASEKGSKKGVMEELARAGGKTVGPVAHNEVTEQSVKVPRKCLLSGFKVMGATYRKEPTADLTVEVGVDGRTVSEGMIPRRSMSDNAWWSYEFIPVVVQAEGTVRVRMVNKGEGAVTFYACEKGWALEGRVKTKVGVRSREAVAMNWGRMEI